MFSFIRCSAVLSAMCCCVAVSALAANTNVWQGGDAAGPAAWELAANWTSGHAPAAALNEELLIPAGLAVYPVLTADATAGGNLTIEAGASLSLQGHTLTLGGMLKPAANGQLVLPTGGPMRLQATLGAGGRLVEPGLSVPPRLSPGQVAKAAALDDGPAIPAGTVLHNLAPACELESLPYTTLIFRAVDEDPHLRTLVQPEKGLPIRGYRLWLRFPEPRPVATVSWSLPNGPWALFADTDGDGDCETLLRLDLVGTKLSSWAARQTMTQRFWPPVKAHAIQFMNPSTAIAIYDIQVLSPEPLPAALTARPPRPEVPTAQDGTPLEVAPPPLPEQYLKGFHIEPWMFNYLGWTKSDPRPPLREWANFRTFIASLKKYHANYVNLWPARNVGGTPRGKGQYELDVLWPSQYDRHVIAENHLAEIAAAFKAEGITFFAMDRVSFPRPLAEMPASPTRDLPAPYFSRTSREYWAGYAAEQTAAGVDGVGIGFDEQYVTAIRYPQQADEFTRQVFRERYGMDIPAAAADSPAFRRWILFAYGEFGSFLQGIAAAARKVNPQVVTNSPVTALDTLWNERLDWGAAHDVLGHTADLDVLRASGYLDFSNLNHYVTAASVERAKAATRSRGVTSLHNCPWANDPAKFPGFYLHFPPVYMYSPLSAFLHGAKITSYWRQNYIFYGGYDQQVRECFAMLDTLAAWGMKNATPPREVVVLKSRASEDWWQLRSRHHPEGNPLDQYRGFIHEKWVLEALLTTGQPFAMRYLDHPEDLADLNAYKVIVVPFAYSVPEASAVALEQAVAAGVPLILLGGRGEVDEYGDPRPAPRLAGLLQKPGVTALADDVLVAGHRPSVTARFRKLVTEAVGPARAYSADSYGDDVETVLLTKGDRERFVGLINWTDRDVACDLSLTLPAGSYRVRQADPAGARELTVAGREIWQTEDLRHFRVPLSPWQARVLHIAAADEPAPGPK